MLLRQQSPCFSLLNFSHLNRFSIKIILTRVETCIMLFIFCTIALLCCPFAFLPSQPLQLIKPLLIKLYYEYLLWEEKNVTPLFNLSLRIWERKFRSFPHFGLSVSDYNYIWHVSFSAVPYQINRSPECKWNLMEWVNIVRCFFFFFFLNLATSSTCA